MQAEEAHEGSHGAIVKQRAAQLVHLARSLAQLAQQLRSQAAQGH